MCLCFSRRRKTVENFSSLSRKCFRWVNNQTLFSLVQIHKAHMCLCLCVCVCVCVFVCVWLIKEQLALWSRFLERHSLPCPCVSDPHRHVSVLSYNTHTLMSHEGIEWVEHWPSYQHTLHEQECGNDVICSAGLSRQIVCIFRSVVFVFGEIWVCRVLTC